MATSACPHPKTDLLLSEHTSTPGSQFIKEQDASSFVTTGKRVTPQGQLSSMSGRSGRQTWDQHLQAQVAPRATAVGMQGSVWSPSGLLETIGRACLVPSPGH